MKSYAVDLGGTSIKVAIVIDGEIMAQDFINVTSESLQLDASLQLIETMITKLDKPTSHLKTAGIGIAFAGLVDPVKKQIIVSNGKYPNAERANLEKWAKDTFDLPLVLENDANAALLGEVHYGVAKGCSDVVLMILGTGVGTSAMMNRQLIRGKHYQAGCLGGHFTLNPEGPRCNCGNIGCVEAHASTWALPLRLAELERKNKCSSGVEITNFKQLKEAYYQKNPLAHQLVEDCVKAWGSGLVSLIHAYDPEVIVLSGGVTYFEELIEPLKNWVHQHAWTPWGRVTIKQSTTPQSSVLCGLHYQIEALNQTLSNSSGGTES